jgi:quinol monooxygenase YgiN
MLIITGYIYVDLADLAQFRADLTALAAVTRQRAGNISYDAAIDTSEPGRLLMAERWVDQAALNAHLAAADTIAFVDRWGGLFRADIRKYDASNERDLIDR